MKVAVKILLFVFIGLLIGWICYWAGFARSLTIGLYMHHEEDCSQALIYKHFADKLEAGKVDEVRSSMNELSDLLKKESILEEQAIRNGKEDSVLDLLVPSAPLSLIHDYESRSAVDLSKSTCKCGEGES